MPGRLSGNRRGVPLHQAGAPTRAGGDKMKTIVGCAGCILLLVACGATAELLPPGTYEVAGRFVEVGRPVAFCDGMQANERAEETFLGVTAVVRDSADRSVWRRIEFPNRPPLCFLEPSSFIAEGWPCEDPDDLGAVNLFFAKKVEEAATLGVGPQTAWFCDGFLTIGINLVEPLAE